MEDTSPEIAKKMCEMIQLKSPLERAQMGSSMHETSKYLILRHLLLENPNISKADIRKALFLKFYRDDFDPESRQKILKHLEAVTS